MRPILLATLATTALGTLLPLQSALACGGFFCNRDIPVDQNAERIVFGLEDDGTIDTHVQIFYQGDAQDFAWIVPAPSVPELFLSSDMLFSQLNSMTRPSFNLNRVEEGDCKERVNLFGGVEYSMDASTADTGEADDGVNVISEAQVGPYDTVILQADSAEGLLDWLQANSYDLPDTLDTALSPYVAMDSYFVALRLQSGKSTGDIEPLGMTYEGDKPLIPIQLTSIAATPDMRLETYIFGDQRAVPESYLHVQINEAAIDWFGNGQNYEDVITMAADEAGGHAFATDFSGPTAPLRGTVYSEGRYNVDVLRSETHPGNFIRAMASQGFPANNIVLQLFQEHIPMPSWVDAELTEFYDCIECYLNASQVNALNFDPNALADDLAIYIVEPLKMAEELFTSHETLTRLTSSVSPAEMTIDPTFVLNPDMGEVDRFHSADLVYECLTGRYWNTATRRIELADGRIIKLPSEKWFANNGTTESEFLAELGDMNAIIIEETTTSGQPTVIFDGSAEANAQLDAFNEWVANITGCGCSAAAASPASLGALGLLMTLFVGRRRNQRR